MGLKILRHLVHISGVLHHYFWIERSHSFSDLSNFRVCGERYIGRNSFVRCAFCRCTVAFALLKYVYYWMLLGRRSSNH